MQDDATSWDTPIHDPSRGSRPWRAIVLWLAAAVAAFWLFGAMMGTMLDDFPSIGWGLMSIGLAIADELPAIAIGTLLVLTVVWIFVHGLKDRQLAERIIQDATSQGDASNEPVTQPLPLKRIQGSQNARFVAFYSNLRNELGAYEQEKAYRVFLCVEAYPDAFAAFCRPGMPYTREVAATLFYQWQCEQEYGEQEFLERELSEDEIEELADDILWRLRRQRGDEEIR